MIDTTAEQARFEGKIFCYVAIHSPISGDDRFAIGIAVLGEPGYSFASALELFATYSEASIRAEELNRAFPYSVDACVAIVADTMIRQRERRPTLDRLGDLLLDAEKDGTLDRLAGDVKHAKTITDFCDAVHMFR
jgi:hypothetical protein